MTTASPLPGAVAPATAYAGFAARFRALLVDTIVIMGSVMVGALLAIAAPSTELTGRILLLALVCLIALLAGQRFRFSRSCAWCSCTSR